MKSQSENFVNDAAELKRQRLRRADAKYRETHRAEIKERKHQYYLAHKEELSPKNRARAMLAYENNKEKSRENHKQWLKKNKLHCKQYSAEYNRKSREMTNRAKQICPAFMFLSNVRRKNLQKYTCAYGINERVVLKTAKVCDALRVMDNQICPLVSREISDAIEMENTCPMKGAFIFDESATIIAYFAAALAKNNSK